MIKSAKSVPHDIRADALAPQIQALHGGGMLVMNDGDRILMMKSQMKPSNKSKTTNITKNNINKRQTKKITINIPAPKTERESF